MMMIRLLQVQVQTARHPAWLQLGLDCFSKYMKYLRNFEKQFELTKNSDFFGHSKHATLSHHFEPS